MNRSTGLVLSLASSVLAVLLALPFLTFWQPQALLLAPMIGQTEPCHSQSALPPEFANDPAFTLCTSEKGSAAAVIESTLLQLGPRHSPNGRYELGYTLNVPLLKFWVQRNGNWVLDHDAIARTVKTIDQSDRHLILYLFSTHFSSFSPFEAVLAADPANVAVTQEGPLGMGKHYGMDVYPWTVARTDNSLSRARADVIRAFADAICQHPSPRVRERIRGITLLGEVHHLFPDFEAGMGYGGKYLITDYSPTSVQQFRSYLQQQYGHISKLNTTLGGATFSNFNAIHPPSKDIRKDSLQHFWEHIDAYADGTFPVSGWLAPQANLTGTVLILVNGVVHARVPSVLSRQDVKDHLPNLGTANVGWRHDLAFRSFAPGIYDIAAMAETHSGPPVLLGTRDIAVMDRTQSTPQRIPGQVLPPHIQMPGIQASLDQPASQASYFYNPLATLWREFREQQVVHYLQHMAQPLRDSCLVNTPRYVHQLFPYPNPSWDSTKFAVNASLTQESDLRLGVSLYGEASYGQSFFKWKHNTWPAHNGPLAQHRKIYGITEFHPLRGMPKDELRSVFDRHQKEGAQFLSFFLEGRGTDTPSKISTEPTIPYLGESNTQNGSDLLYRSVKSLMQQP